MYQTMTDAAEYLPVDDVAEFMTELPMNLALFACGAFGWWGTRWANRRYKEHVRSRELVSRKSVDEDEEDRLAERLYAAGALPEPERLPEPSCKDLPEEAPSPRPSSLVDLEEPEPTPPPKELPSPVAEAPEATATSTEEVETPEMSARVAKLIAKKAERKARKAHERELEEQQQGEAAEAALAAAARLQELRIDVASIEAEVEAEEAEVEEEALSLVSTSEPEGHHVATDEEDEDEDEDEAAWPSTPRSELAQQDEVWMVGCLTQDVVPSVPIGAEFVQTSEGSMITAVDLHMHRYHPILSDDGQQLYTDGEQVYVMACVDTSASAGSAEDAGGADSPQVMHAVTDPWDPMHQMASTGSEYCGDVYMGATYCACGDYSAQDWPQEMMYQSQLLAGGGHDDGLWDVPWEF